MLAIMNRALAGRVIFNFLANNLQNAREIYEVAEGAVIFGVKAKDYSSVKQLNETVSAFKEEFGVVSLVLGDGDPGQWNKVIESALAISPGHINQVFPALGYTLGALEAKGILSQNIVNALVSFSGTPGKVNISTGILSKGSSEPATVPIETALKMIKEIGGRSLKVLPFDSKKRLGEFEIIVAAALKEKIDIIEPTGGINASNLIDILKICVAGSKGLIIPHIHNAVMNSSKQKTDPKKVAHIVALTKEFLNNSVEVQDWRIN